MSGVPGVPFFLSVTILIISSSFLPEHAGAVNTDPSEAKALKAMKSSLIDPMMNLVTWNNGDPCTSSWTGIFCTSILNDGYLHIQEVQLLRLNLSGTLVPDLGLLSHLNILDIMWNNISGSIPKEIGNMTSLKLLLLSGNQLSGSLPDEIGLLTNLNRLQIDQNQITGPIPTSFANLNYIVHLHMNNNSISGQLPPELSRLPRLLHLLVDNNNLSGYLPPEYSGMPNLKILQLDNNNFDGATIPASYGNMTTLLKLSLRNCSLHGTIPDLSGIPHLTYLDLSWNQLKGTIPSNKLSINLTTIDLSSNFLNGSIPSSFTGFPSLQRLSLRNNLLNGLVPLVWKNMTFSGNESLILDFQNNSLSNISDTLNPPSNVSILIYGNPTCENVNQPNLIQFCQPQNITPASGSTTSSNLNCFPCPTDLSYEYNPLSPIPCLCAVPLGVGLRLKSPSISDFRPYIDAFEINLASLLNLYRYQLYFERFIWEKGPRLTMNMKLFPSNSSLFNVSEVLRLQRTFTGWEITLSDTFGPYELLNFTLGSYANVIPMATKPRLSTGSFVGILLGSVAGALIVSAVATALIMRRRSRHRMLLQKRSRSSTRIKVADVKDFTLEEMAVATNNFSKSAELGHGGYGKVYKGILADGTLVAVKRAHAGSLQGSVEFFTEIELLSRLHHRNLVSLVGYCDEDDEQLLVYEFMPNGTLRDHLSASSLGPLNFSMRLRIAMETARAILYLHTEADPPIIHRDIKASNILLDSKFVAKVADFGLSRLAPVPDIEGIVPGHVSTVVKGTPGYLDPEYFLTRKLTDKSDVYSLGVVFLELITGMRPISHGKNIVREMSNVYRSSETFSMVDSSMGSYPSECIQGFVSLAIRCCHEETDARPAMPEVTRELEKLWNMMPEIDTTFLVTKETDTGNTAKHSYSSTKQHVSSDTSRSDISSSIPPVVPR
ncbi:putative LRR receptor-like serine/threonine-protein kinase isoform X2 [Iris pallida]|uniref:non-specific serine/threonine protein kinase n=1 Tax=Iris pallida TaxID=29817 RepID=A0AAX6GIB7_IRIPA|nr:putative LRR receptor-like serine/threonine-protein kinase isoform X2 [Iris pallida]KAJ6827971.1 putative LRR receptor-like serine/threonine-protein kinase isoform X2 [Iris pallida]